MRGRHRTAAARVAALTVALAVGLGLGAVVPAEVATAASAELALSTEVHSYPQADYALPGDTLAYTLTVTNTGTEPVTSAEPVEISQVAAAGTTALGGISDPSVNPSGGAVQVSGNNLVWTIDDLPAGDTATLRYEVGINEWGYGFDRADDVITTHTFVGTVAPAECVTASSCVATTTTVGSVALTLAATAGQSTVNAGDEIEWTITVTNTGTAPGFVTVYDYPDEDSVDYFEADGAIWVGKHAQWNEQQIGPGQTLTMSAYSVSTDRSTTVEVVNAAAVGGPEFGLSYDPVNVLTPCVDDPLSSCATVTVTGSGAEPSTEPSFEPAVPVPPVDTGVSTEAPAELAATGGSYAAGGIAGLALGLSGALVVVARVVWRVRRARGARRAG